MSALMYVKSALYWNTVITRIKKIIEEQKKKLFRLCNESILIYCSKYYHFFRFIVYLFLHYLIVKNKKNHVSNNKNTII